MYYYNNLIVINYNIIVHVFFPNTSNYRTLNRDNEIITLNILRNLVQFDIIHMQIHDSQYCYSEGRYRSRSGMSLYRPVFMTLWHWAG